MRELKQIAREIFQQTLAAIDIKATMQRKLWREGTLLRWDGGAIDLRGFSSVRVVAMGKAAHAMVEGLRAVLGRKIEVKGIVSAPTPAKEVVPGVKYFVSGHPVPNAESFKAGEAILALLRDCDQRTLVLFLFSGGGSALVEMPLVPGLTLAEVQQVYRALVNCGASIDEINAVRKHLSAVKGGRLAVAAGQACKVTLAVSDVPVGCESALASGPTLPDPSTIADAERVIREYELAEKLPKAVREWLGTGKMPETPKANDEAFANAHFLLLLGMDDLFHPAHHAAEAHGFAACCDNTTDEWPVEKSAEYLLGQLRDLRERNPGRPVAVIADGEVSSRVTGDGIGGRNAAFVLACVERIAGEKVAVLSAGTDGIDGNSPAAGAVADGETLSRAKAAGLGVSKAFQDSDAFTFFVALDDAIITGATGNNLRDLRILIAE